MTLAASSGKRLRDAGAPPSVRLSRRSGKQRAAYRLSIDICQRQRTAAASVLQCDPRDEDRTDLSEKRLKLSDRFARLVCRYSSGRHTGSTRWCAATSVHSGVPRKRRRCRCSCVSHWRATSHRRQPSRQVAATARVSSRGCDGSSPCPRAMPSVDEPAVPLRHARSAPPARRPPTRRSRAAAGCSSGTGAARRRRSGTRPAAAGTGLPGRRTCRCRRPAARRRSACRASGTR